MKYGIKIVPSSMRKNLETDSEARKRRALAFDKDLLPRHKPNRDHRVRHQTDVLYLAAWLPIDRLDGRNVHGKERVFLEQDFRYKNDYRSREERGQTHSGQGEDGKGAHNGYLGS